MNASIARTLLGASALALAAAAPASAQGNTVVPRSHGLILGAGASGTNFSPEDGDGTSGGGLNLHLGWAFTPKFSVLLNGDAAAVKVEELDDVGVDEDFTLVHGDLLARYSFFNPARKFVPFVEGGFTSRTFASQDEIEIEGESEDLEYSGPAFTLGGGVNVFFTPSVALNLGLKYSIGKFNTVKFGGTSITSDELEMDANSTRFSLGITWMPMGPRK